MEVSVTRQWATRLIMYVEAIAGTGIGGERELARARVENGDAEMTA